jgi:hypothetical protein
MGKPLSAIPLLPDVPNVTLIYKHIASLVQHAVGWSQTAYLLMINSIVTKPKQHTFLKQLCSFLIPFGEVFIEERNNTWNTPYLFNYCANERQATLNLV